MNIERIVDKAHNSNREMDHKAVYDFRFRQLLPKQGWDALPTRVKQRFSKRMSDGRIALYHGEVTDVRFNSAGVILAQLLRLFAAPLPISNHIGVPAVVAVAEDPVKGGQIWTRTYHNHAGFPQTINSAKRFAGPTGLEEHIGFGIGMALKADVIDQGIIFTSDHYFWNIGKMRFKIPALFCPGETKVCHIDKGDGAFDFELMLEHPIFGELIYQRARFNDIGFHNI